MVTAYHPKNKNSFFRNTNGDNVIKEINNGKDSDWDSVMWQQS